MSISTDDWMRLLDSVVDDGRMTSDDDIDFFFWQKYCALDSKVRSAVKKIEHYVFSDANIILQRIFSHRTQEYDGVDAKIGIPMAFELAEVNDYATFTYQSTSYGDFYYFNKYRIVDAIPGAEEGDEVAAPFS